MDYRKLRHRQRCLRQYRVYQKKTLDNATKRYTKWEPLEEQYLIENHKKQTACEIAMYLNRSFNSIKKKAPRLGLDMQADWKNWIALENGNIVQVKEYQKLATMCAQADMYSHI